MYVCMCMYVCMYVNVIVYISCVRWCVCMCVYISVCVHMSSTSQISLPINVSGNPSKLSLECLLSYSQFTGNVFDDVIITALQNSYETLHVFRNNQILSGIKLVLGISWNFTENSWRTCISYQAFFIILFIIKTNVPMSTMNKSFSSYDFFFIVISFSFFSTYSFSLSSYYFSYYSSAPFFIFDVVVFIQCKYLSIVYSNFSEKKRKR